MKESVVVAVRYENKALIVHKPKTAPDSLADQWHLPGGGKHPGESTMDVGVRETLEETGAHIHVTKQLYSNTTKKGTHVHWVAGEIVSSIDELVAGDDVDSVELIDIHKLPTRCAQAYKQWPTSVKNYFSE